MTKREREEDIFIALNNVIGTLYHEGVLAITNDRLGELDFGDHEPFQSETAVRRFSLGPSRLVPLAER